MRSRSRRGVELSRRDQTGAERRPAGEIEHAVDRHRQAPTLRRLAHLPRAQRECRALEWVHASSEGGVESTATQPHGEPQSGALLRHGTCPHVRLGLTGRFAVIA
jgi:hypothetical protein